MRHEVSVIECAILSADVYNPKSHSNYLKQINWFAIDLPSNTKRKSLNLKYGHPFFARIYIKKSPNYGKPTAAVIAYRGTQFTKHINNDIDDAEIALHIQPGDEDLAKAFYTSANQYIMKNYKLQPRLTGHSLGGAIAQLTAIASAFHPQTIVFNSPGVGDVVGNSNRQFPYIHNIDSRDGEINKVGKEVGTVTDINVTQDEIQVKKYGWLDVEAWLNQHKIADVIAALKNDPKIASERF